MDMTKEQEALQMGLQSFLRVRERQKKQPETRFDPFVGFGRYKYVMAVIDFSAIRAKPEEWSAAWENPDLFN